MTAQSISSAAPYYDDFDPSKGFNKILFKPGYAVQARELTGMQSILQNQITSFGDNIFQNGSVVVPGRIKGDLSVPYVTFSAFAGDISVYTGKTLVSATGVKAVVKSVVAATTSDPMTFYVGYVSGGTGGETTFLPSETLSVQGYPTMANLTTAATGTTGYGSIAYISDGVFYVNGFFANVNLQSVIMSKYGSNPSVHVLLKITESVVTSYDDDSLLDPSNGSDNFAAPGADRYKIDLTLTTLPYGTAFDDNYIEIMRYNDGVLEEQVQYPKYNQIEKELARRTYDEAGDFVQSGYDLAVREHKKTQFNNGLYESGDVSKFVYQFGSGKAYIKGYEKSAIGIQNIVVDKARTSDHIKFKDGASVATNWGQWLYVTAPTGSPDYNSLQTVQFWNTDDNTNVSTAIQVGTAQAVAIDYEGGDPTANTAIFRLFITGLSMTAGYSIEDIGGIRFTGGSFAVCQRINLNVNSGTFQLSEVVNFNGGVRSAKIRYSNNGLIYFSKNSVSAYVPKIGDQIVGATSTAAGSITGKLILNTAFDNQAIFPLPFSNISTVKNSLNAYQNAVNSWQQFQITTNASGNGSTSISSGIINSPDVGSMVAISSAGVLPIANLSVSSGTTLTITGGPASTVVTVFCVVTKTNVSVKTKTLVSTSITVTSTSSTFSIPLGQADIYAITSVTGPTGDVTANYTLDNGQRDFAYLLGSLKTSTPIVGSLTIAFQYFQHSPSGDFFSVDSYTTLGADYISLIPSYTSVSTGLKISLANSLDFRKTVGTDGSYTSGTAVPIYYPVSQSVLTSSLGYYVGRVDTLGLSQNGDIVYVKGVPSETPVATTFDENGMVLYRVSVPPYTFNVGDITVTDSRIKVYTMKDVGTIDSRLTNLENAVALTNIEKSLITNQVIDPVTGLTRFKTGYLAEDFSNIEETSVDLGNVDHAATFENDTQITPAQIIDYLPLNLQTSSSSYVSTGGLITLPYTHNVLVSQLSSSEIKNLNPFSAVTWEGLMTITPDEDKWVDQELLPTIYRTTQITGSSGFGFTVTGIYTTNYTISPQFVVGPSVAPVVTNTGFAMVS